MIVRVLLAPLHTSFYFLNCKNIYWAFTLEWKKLGEMEVAWEQGGQDSRQGTWDEENVFLREEGSWTVKVLNLGVNLLVPGLVCTRNQEMRHMEPTCKLHMLMLGSRFKNRTLRQLQGGNLKQDNPANGECLATLNFSRHYRYCSYFLCSVSWERFCLSLK